MSLAPSAAPAPSVPLRPSARRWFVALAGWTWLGLAIQFVISATGMYPSQATKPSAYGYFNAPGAEGAVGRIVDYFSYFTIWSNITVAVVATLLALDPARDGRWMRAVRLSGLLMISITGLVYGVILAGLSELRGWEVLANFFIHQSVPLLAVVVFVVAGPRGWIDWPTIARSMVLPLVWLAYVLVRGVVIDAYPYFFLDVAVLGYPAVLVNLLGVLALGLLIAVGFLYVDRWLTRRATR
jgi:hypothetical protein